ncbi:MAG: ester cyclase [Bacteroidota bacterium]|nr:ester cyclase [Bacteroidota bacterium]MEE3244867.1 ester cyclase [Bacteroidota bacterium]
MEEYKTIASTFLKEVAFGNIDLAFKKYVAEDFMHHNQYFEGSRDALMQAMKEDHKTNPNLDFEIKKVYADGNTVITHSLVSKQTMQIAVVHISRFENNRIVELWDLGQIIEKDSPNKNGLF